jgi:dATP pyrophosphohydrolase
MKSNTDWRLIDLYPYRIRQNKPEFLLLRRSENVLYPGQWRMIGGKVKPGETASAAALRELMEETGLSPKSFWCVPSVNVFFEHQLDKMHYIPVFAAELSEGSQPVLNHEHSEYGWFPVDDASEQLKWPEQRRLIYLVSGIVQSGRLCKEWIITA